MIEITVETRSLPTENGAKLLSMIVYIKIVKM